MAAMTVTLTEFANNGNSRTSTLTGHTAVSPRLVIEKRRVPEGNQVIVEYSCKIIYATEDGDGTILSNKISLDCVVRYPLLGQGADVTAALAAFKAILIGDEFANSVTTQEWLT